MSRGLPAATRIGRGTYRIDSGEGRHEIVYVAGSPGDRWAFWRGAIFRSGMSEQTSMGASPRREPGGLPLTAPMPARVLRILAAPGSPVRKGDTVIILEAMKMELPIRAPHEGIVANVHCQVGELVQPETVLVEITWI